MPPRRRATPKSLVLDLLRVTAGRSISVAALVRIGDLFGFTGNAMRVAVTRLVAEGVVESDERGSYRLAAAAIPLVTHVEGWRQGERRLRAWMGDWLAVWLVRGVARGQRQRSLRALDLLGFREGLAGLWVRPNNLSEPASATFEKLSGFGLEPVAEPFVADAFGAAVVERWASSIWPLRDIERGWQRGLDALAKSTAKVPLMPLSRAAAETFLVGGDAIRRLATDPLLPDGILDGAPRAALTQAMLDYDRLGRRIWARLLDEVHLGAAPSHLAVAS